MLQFLETGQRQTRKEKMHRIFDIFFDDGVQAISNMIQSSDAMSEYVFLQNAKAEERKIKQSQSAKSFRSQIKKTRKAEKNYIAKSRPEAQREVRQLEAQTKE